MNCADTARGVVLGCANILEREAGHMSVMRSVDATESAKWLRDIAAELRLACEPTVETNDAEG